MPQLLATQSIAPSPLRPVFIPPTPPTFVHIVTLINRVTGDEKAIEIVTLSDRFTEVMREVTHQRAMLGLKGYEVHETLDCNFPF